MTRPVSISQPIKAGTFANPHEEDSEDCVTVAPLEELVLKLTIPHIMENDGAERAVATAELVYLPADKSPAIRSSRYTFTAPIGETEQDEVRWYIESYYRWPTGVFKQRADVTEAALPEWGKLLYAAVLADKAATAPLNAWLANPNKRCFSVEIDAGSAKNNDAEKAKRCHEAASRLLSLPWEIMHDGSGYLFQGSNRVQIRRRLPSRKKTTTAKAKLPIRVLLLRNQNSITSQSGAECLFQFKAEKVACSCST